MGIREKERDEKTDKATSECERTLLYNNFVITLTLALCSCRWVSAKIFNAAGIQRGSALGLYVTVFPYY